MCEPKRQVWRRILGKAEGLGLGSTEYLPRRICHFGCEVADEIYLPACLGIHGTKLNLIYSL